MVYPVPADEPPDTIVSSSPVMVVLVMLISKIEFLTPITSFELVFTVAVIAALDVILAAPITRLPVA